LADVDGVVWVILILVDYVKVGILNGLLLINSAVIRSLYRSKSASLTLCIDSSFDHATSCSWWDHILLTTFLLGAHLLAPVIRSEVWVLADINGCICPGCGGREESFWLSRNLVLSVIKSLVIGLRYSCACCDPCHIATLSLHRFDN